MIQQFITAIAVVGNIALGIIILARDKKSATGILFFLFALTNAVTSISNYLSLNSPNDQSTLFWIRMVMFCAAFMGLFFYLFASTFPSRSILIKKFWFYLLIIFALIDSIIAISPWLFTKVTINDLQIQPAPGPGMLPYMLIFISMIIGGIILLIKNYLRSKGNLRTQYKFLFSGLALTFIFIIAINLILVNVYKISSFQFMAGLFTLIYVATIAYAIVKHNLFNIRVIVTEIAVAIINIILITQIFSSRTVLEGLLRSLFFVLVFYGSYILVNSVHREIKQREEIQKLADDLKVANEHLKDLDKLKDDFLSMAAHELNTPLAAITGYLSMILEENIGGEVNPKIKKYLENMFTSSKRLTLLIKDMLNVSRIESGRIHLIYADTPIESVIEQAIAEIGSKAKERNQSLIYHKPKVKMPHTWFDASRVTEVLINIIGNAIKYTDTDGKIEVFVKNDEKFITVSIKDNGRGIPKDKIDTVFEKFSQVDILKDEIKGTGLGMYISKKFIELMGGKIWFDSVESKGSIFYFTLPILKDKPEDPHEGEGEVLH